MKSRFAMFFAAITVFAALAIPLGWPRRTNHKHEHR
jgi:hypothetical protein